VLRLLSWTFCSLRHESGSKVHWSGRIPPLPSFRLQGLTTLLTIYSLRALVSFVSRSPHPWDSPLRSFAPPTGLAVSPSRATHMPFTGALTRGVRPRAAAPAATSGY
jgi:hypothetical protein